MKQRVITGILAGALFLAVTMIGGIPFTLLAVLMAAVGYSECLRMKQITPYSTPGLIGFALVIVIVSGVRFSIVSTVELLVIGTLLLLVLTALSRNTFHFDHSAFIIISVLYVSFGFYYLVEARELGFNTAFFVLLMIWLTDSGAYFSGRSFGRRKLAPSISPKKTVEGAFGGLMAAFIGAVLYQLIAPVYTTIWIAASAAVLIAVFGQLGDLVESALKRHYGVKDSGTVLPGHGGILDRCDSWLFVFPVLHMLHFL